MVGGAFRGQAAAIASWSGFEMGLTEKRWPERSTVAHPLPASRKQACLAAEMLQHPSRPPSLFRGDLGKEHGRTILADQNAVPADDDVVGAGDRNHRC